MQKSIFYPENFKLNIEEFATRINLLDRHDSRSEILKLHTEGTLTLEEAEKYSEQIAQLMPFLDKKVNIEDIQKVVTKQKEKSDTGFG